MTVFRDVKLGSLVEKYHISIFVVQDLRMETIGSCQIMIPTTEPHSFASQIINLVISHTTNQGYYYYRYSALGPVWVETRAQSGDWYSSGTLHPGQVLRGRLPLLSPDKIFVDFHSFDSETPASHRKGVCSVPPSSKSASLTSPEGGGTSLLQEVCSNLQSTWHQYPSTLTMRASNSALVRTYKSVQLICKTSGH